MLSTSVTVTDEDLNKILGAASKEVQNIYQRFQTKFPNLQMREVGLTDLFILRAQETADQEKKPVKFDLSKNENQKGSDFELTINGGRQIFFQAKILKSSSKGLYGDFLYESKKKVDDQVILEYQNLLLVECARKNNTQAYYVIYEDKTVRWVNAAALANWLGGSGKTGSNVAISVEAFENLAKASYLEATKDPWLQPKTVH
ncbi:hypothetical protein FPCIR_2209 [Fusarium pseudocircinatum]|uniref:Uncharacterized protein n=1 Tax=Fusarium pseudocircinatum TaxID=56676 RepID=A0A8H5UY71_9HYPO|nr:hypothetical protein FPCIR_2209 [Fusarium pseudocircinatum]